MKLIALRVPETLHESLRELAFELNTSVAELSRSLVTHAMARRQRQLPQPSPSDTNPVGLDTQ